METNKLLEELDEVILRLSYYIHDMRILKITHENNVIELKQPAKIIPLKGSDCDH
jgi:hypothetical protein